MSVWGRAWMDADGRHVWCSHTCNGKDSTFKMPWPMWHATPDGKTVTPSLVCEVPGCGFHQVLTIEDRS